MTVLYVKEQGAVVRRDVEQIRVTRKQEKQPKSELLAELPVREVEQVVLYGNVQLTTQAAALLLQNEVDVVFLSHYGRYRGRLSKTGSKNAKVRHAQLQLAGDDKRSLDVAKGIVRAKLGNQRNTLYALAAGTGLNTKEGLNRAAQGIDQMRKECGRAGDLDSLRGYEGKGGALYFESFRNLLPPAWGFAGRNYHPPQDPFNALLSFGYALLQKDMTTTAEVVGLDPYLGCFHALEYGRPSLILDLMEEFRPLAVDRMVLALVLDGHISPQDFSFTGRKERPVELGDKLIPQVIQAYEAGLEVQVDHNPSGQLRLLRHCLELQARIYASVVVGSRKEYVGLVA